MISELWAGPFSNVAERHPYAQFPSRGRQTFSPGRSAENYEIADPLFEWHVAQDAVNQGRLGYGPASIKRGHSALRRTMDLPFTAMPRSRPVRHQRPDLSRSRADELVLKRPWTLGKVCRSRCPVSISISCFPLRRS